MFLDVQPPRAILLVLVVKLPKWLSKMKSQMEGQREKAYKPALSGEAGRQRPAKFNTIWTEIGFCFSLLASMVMAVNTLSSQNGEDSTAIYTAGRSTSSAASM